MQFHYALAATSVLTHATKHPKQNNLESDLFVGISPLQYTTYQTRPSNPCGTPTNPLPSLPASLQTYPSESISPQATQAARIARIRFLGKEKPHADEYIQYPNEWSSICNDQLGDIYKHPMRRSRCFVFDNLFEFAKF